MWPVPNPTLLEKHPLLVHLESSQLARIAQAGEVESYNPNEQIVVEGEEEVGSGSLGEFLRTHKKMLAADAIVLCSYAPGGASATRQLRAAGISAPILAATAMDGNFWLDAVPNLSDFYYPVLGSVYGDDPDPAINDFLKKYQAKYDAAPAESHTLAGYALMQLYAAAVTKANSVDAKAVTAAAESFKDQPTLLGPYSFSPELHIQTKYRFTIMSVENGKHKSVETWTSQTPMTTNVLFRKAD